MMSLFVLMLSAFHALPAMQPLPSPLPSLKPCCPMNLTGCSTLAARLLDSGC
jgi:hypothetical protein